MYLRSSDYLPYIQDSNLQQVITSDDSNRILVESLAQEEAAGYLRQKYDVDKEFTSTDDYSVTQRYFGRSRVNLAGFSNYSTVATYTATNKTIVIYNGNAYIVKNNSAAPAGAFVSADWDLLGQVNQLFFLDLPYPEFILSGSYAIGDRVFWKDKIYQAKKATQQLTHYDALQDGKAPTSNVYNVFPDDPTNGTSYWGTGVSYSVTGLSPTATASNYSGSTSYSVGNRVLYNSKMECLIAGTGKTPGDDITHWQSETWINKDNRNQSLVKILVDITLYYVHSRISPQNIPVLRVVNYMGHDSDRVDMKGELMFPPYSALGKLQRYANGNLSPGIPLNMPTSTANIQPRGRITFNSEAKKINGY